MMQTAFLEISRAFNVWEPIATAPIERTYTVAYHEDINGNYKVRQMPQGTAFIVQPRAFKRVTGSNADYGTMDLSYSQLAAIGGICV